MEPSPPPSSAPVDLQGRLGKGYRGSVTSCLSGYIVGKFSSIAAIRYDSEETTTSNHSLWPSLSGSSMTVCFFSTTQLRLLGSLMQ